MIVCRIEMWPGGDQSRAYDLGCVEITNEGGTESHGDYAVRLTKSARLSKRPGTAWKRGAVLRFPRLRLGAYDLLLRALANVIGDRNPDAADAAAVQLATIERQAGPARLL